jgi:Niemann-Pick C1 protein
LESHITVAYSTLYCNRFILCVVILLSVLQAVGISVEFCSHLVHSFAVSVKETRVQRAADALTRMGSSVSWRSYKRTVTK